MIVANCWETPSSARDIDKLVWYHLMTKDAHKEQCKGKVRSLSAFWSTIISLAKSIAVISEHFCGHQYDLKLQLQLTYRFCKVVDFSRLTLDLCVPKQESYLSEPLLQGNQLLCVKYYFKATELWLRMDDREVGFQSSLASQSPLWPPAFVNSNYCNSSDKSTSIRKKRQQVQVGHGSGWSDNDWSEPVVVFVDGKQPTSIHLPHSLAMFCESFGEASLMNCVGKN